MGLQVGTICQKKKSSVAKHNGLGDNAGLTGNILIKHELTGYVNICNYSTPDIVGKGQEKTDIL